MSGIEPVRTPRGALMPRILYGTAWKKERTAALVEQALSLGFRGLDTACQPKHYDEALVGVGLRTALAAGLSRGDVFVQTKFTPLSGQDPKRVPYDPKAELEQQVQQSCQRSLENLGVSRLDCLVVHSPLSPFERTLRVWKEMERLVEAGLVLELGISNCYDLAVLKSLFERASIKPVVLQNRFYADTGYDREIRAFCRQQGLVYQSFWTLSANPHVLSHQRVRALSARYRVTPAQILFRGLTQLGVHPLTGTTSAEHMRDDLGIFAFELSAKELAELDALFR